MSKVRKLTLTGVFVALGIILPVAFHSIPNAGGIFLPMHIPVLMCGLVCGFPYGFLCGALTPLLSGLLTGMPPAAILPAMLVELSVYGLVSGLLLRHVHTKHTLADIYLSLAGAMIAGRIVSGVTKALLFNVGEYSIRLWVASSFVTALPGIVIQLAVIPALVFALRKANLIAPAYASGA